MIKVILPHSYEVIKVAKRFVLFVVLYLLSTGLLFAQSAIKDSKVTLRLINSQTGALFEGVEAAFSVSSTDLTLINNNISDTIVTSTKLGSIELQLIKNVKYRASVLFLKNGVPVNNGLVAPDGKYYLIPRETILFTPPADQRTFVDFLLSPANTLLDVTVSDNKGEPIKSGFVQAYSAAFSESGEDKKEHWVGDKVVDGKVTFPVLQNRGYRVSFSAQLSGLIPPEDTQVAISGAGRYGSKIAMKATNHTILTTATINGTSPDNEEVSFFFCYAYNKAGQHTKGESEDRELVSLHIENAKALAWRVGCQMNLTRDGTEILYKGEVDYQVAGAASGSLAVPLEVIKGYFPETAYEFPSGKDTTIKAPDGKAVLSVPANAFSQGGTINVVLRTGQGYVITSESTPVLAYDIKLFLDGTQITQMGQPVLISIPIDADEIAELGGTINDVYPAYYDDENGKWIRETNYTYDESTGTLKIYVSHFSIWGALVDLVSGAGDSS